MEEIKEYYKKILKESLQQIDEVSPPGMKKMTHSSAATKNFNKQYGKKKGKTIKYATAWKLKNK